MTVDFKLVRGKCTVVYSEEFTPERDNFFLKGEDKFYFAEVNYEAAFAISLPHLNQLVNENVKIDCFVFPKFSPY